MADESIKRIVELSVNATPALRELDKLGAETAKQTAQLNDIQKTLDNFGDNIIAGMKIGAIVGAVQEIWSAFRGLVDEMDQLGKTAQAINMPVEQLQGVQRAFGMAGVNAEDFTKVMSRMASAVENLDDPLNNTSRLLREMGVKTGEDAYAALMKVADAFAAADDSTQKTAISNELFTRQLATRMTPALNAGSQGIAEAAEEMSKFGIVTAEEAARAAEFNDNMTKLAEMAKSVGYAIVNDAVPGLNQLLGGFIKNIQSGAGFLQILKDIDDFVSKQMGQTAAKLAGQDVLPILSDNEVKEMRRKNDEMVASWNKVRSASTEAAKGPSILTESIDALNASMKKSGLPEVKQNELAKYGDRLTQLGVTAELIPQKIALVQKAIKEMGSATTDESRAKLSALNAELERLQKTPKAAGGGVAKRTREDLDEMARWLKSLDKLQETSGNTDEKVRILQGTLNDLEAAGIKNTAWTEALRKELEKLDPDPVAVALRKIADTAEDMDKGQPRLLIAMQMQLEQLEISEKGATTQAQLLREEILKMEAAKDPVKAVTREIDEMTKATARAEAMQVAWWKALASGEANPAQFVEGMNKVLPQVAQGIDDVNDKTKKLSDSIGEMGARFVNDFADQLIENMGKVDQSFGDMIESMLKQLAKLLLNQQFVNLFKAVEGAGGWGNFFSGLSRSAQGNAWDDRGVQYMARGGILAQPTFFSNGGRLAVAGEAGAEAVVPLQRNAAGDLGITAPPVTVNIHNNAPVEVSQQNTTGADGSRQIEVFIEQKVKGMFNNGSMDRTMRQGYGLTRQPISG